MNLKVKLSALISILLLVLLLAACGDEQPTAVALATTTAPTTTAIPTIAPTTTPVPVPTATNTPAPPTATPKPTATATPVPPTATATPSVTIKPLPQNVLLSPMAWEPQKLNNCAPMSALMAMSYYGVNKTQEECAAAMHPDPRNKNNFPPEIIDFLAKNGFKSVLVENGTLDILRKFVANGIPVITQSYSKLHDDIGHYRVIRGYDLAKDVIIINDSLIDHPSATVDSSLEDTLWKAFNRHYFPVYTAKQEPLVKAILGADVDPKANLQRALQAAESFYDKNPKDLDGLRNVGYMRAMTGNYAGAVDIWEKIVALGPIGRFLWYESWPFEAYNKVGKYQQALKWIDDTLKDAPIYSRAYYERGFANNALGNKAQAIKDLKQSLVYGFYQPSRDLLDKLGG